MGQVEEFSQLWKKTVSMVQFEATRLGALSKKIDGKAIEMYFKQNVVQGFWFSKTFPNEFNAWMVSTFDEQPEKSNMIRREMETISLPPLRNNIVWIVVSIVMFIVCLFVGILSEKEGVSGVGYVGAVIFLSSAVIAVMKRSGCTKADIDREMERIKSNIQTKLQ